MAEDTFVARRQREIREEGLAVPLDPDDLRAAARDHIHPYEWSYVDGGAGTGGTMRANRAAFERWRILPRVLTDVSSRDLRVELFGRDLPAPIALSPIGRQERYHPDAEIAVARAAADHGVPLTLSTWSSRSIEEVAEAAGDAPRWFQLYWLEDWDVAASLVARAEAAGYDAVVVTVDSKVPKWRTRHLERTGNRDRPIRRANLETDPVASESPDEGDTSPGSPSFTYDRGLEWDDLAFLRDHTDLPILVKGVLHPGDADRAVEHGLDGIVVSTHGGRQIDGAIGAVEALPGVLDAVDGRIPVLLDSGVRSGADAFKAIALGADAAFVGRPYVFGLAIAGERGAYEVIGNHLAELDSITGLAGFDSIRDVDRSILVDRGD